MQHDEGQTPKRRPRARTGASFPIILKSRKSEASTTTPSSPPSNEEQTPLLPLEDIIEALTPPAVLSPTHARALVLLLQTERPQLELLTPVLSRLCAPGVPSGLLATAMEILSAYNASQIQPPSDIERASLFAFLRASDPDWTADTWSPRLKCLSELTKDGTSVAGFETAFLAYTKDCISSAFEGLFADDEPDRIPREKFLESIARIMRETLTKNASLYTEDDTIGVLNFFESFVQRSLDSLPSGLLPDTMFIPSSPGAAPAIISHRRNASSTGGAIFFPGNRHPPTRDLMSPLDRTLLPISLYMSTFDLYRVKLTPANLKPAISLLVRIISVHLNPLPRLGAWLPPQHQSRPVEDATLSQLFYLLSSPYASTVAAHVKRFLSSLHPQEALGAFRSIRAVLRDAAESRMALVALRQPKFDVEEYAPSGLPVTSDAHAKVLQRAHKEGLEVPALALNRLVSAVGKAVRLWAVKADAEKVLEEALGIVKDVLVEVSDRVDRDDGEDYSSMNIDEGRVVGTILSEAVKYVHRMRKTSLLPIDKMLKTPFLPIDKPAAAPTPLLLTLCAHLALPLSTPMIPSLPSILLSITSHLTDAQTATIPQTMYNLGLLTPTSLPWLDNISDLFTELASRERPISTREVYAVTETIHTDLMGVPAYRRKLGQRVCELAERALTLEENDTALALQGDEAWSRLCANELVWRILESIHGEEQDINEDDDVVERLVAVFVRHVLGSCPCVNVDVDDSPHSDVVISTTAASATPVVSVSSSNASTPVLPRSASEFPVTDKEVPSSQGSTSVLPPLMSILPGWSMPRTREPSAPASPVTLRSSVTASTVVSRAAKDTCRPVCASLALVSAFQDLSFAASPQPAHAVRLFKALLAVLKKAKCPRARLIVLQLLMRLRADRDHRLYILGDLDHDVEGLAALVCRSQSIIRDGPPEDGAEVRRARSVSRGLRRGAARSSAESRSRSRLSPAPAPVPSKPRELLWSVPESLPFDIPVSEPSSEGVTTYEANAPTEWEELKHWLPVSDFVLAIVDILRHETDWDILSYVLCHLPVQLANKHFFCGPKTKSGIMALLVVLCTATLKSDAVSTAAVVEQLPESLRLRDAQDLVFHTLAVLVSYRGLFDERKHHDMLVETFLWGLNGQPSTVKFCLNALSICAYELPSSITKVLAHIMDQLVRIMTNAEMAVHILDFLSIVGSLPSLYSNFREEEFRVVFAAAVTYIHYHNSPDTQGLSGRESFALSQHVLVVAYYIIYVWFLAVALPDRPKHVQFLARKLLLANEAKGAVDEPTEVCFDWLARYTYATADPKPAYSLLGDILMNPPRNAKDEPVESPIYSKTWVWGNSLVTIRTLPKRGWIEVESVRPSGETKFLCKLENVPQVNPGDVDPDMLSDPAIMMSNRDPAQMERSVPDPDDDQSQVTAANQETQDVRNIFVPSGEKEEEQRPDPVTGYVWSQSAPSQRRKYVSVDPSFFALQLSQYPHLPKRSARSRLVPPSEQLNTLLRTLKHTPVIDMHKIAILYVAPGQKWEREILGNRHGSPAYTRFLENIGRLIRVRDQRDVYTGDIIPETDGEYTYAWWDDIVQVVYHTATLMPNLPVDPGFIYKKRHVGNDKVRIVWNDSGLPYGHHTIPSAFNFVNLIVEPHSKGTIAAFSNNKHEHEFFKVTMQRMEGMPAFGPIGDYKLVSAENLAPLLRQVSLLADFFSEVYEKTEKDTSTNEYVTNWRRRLQYINTFRARMESAPLPETAEDAQDDVGLQDVRDFTRFF